MPKTLLIDAPGRGMIDITAAVNSYLSEIKAKNGVLVAFCQHTSASLTIQENADPDVRADLTRFLDRLAPESGDYRHAAEGPDDMPAHIKSALTDVSLSIPVADGRLAMGTWQGLYLCEHRQAAHQRRVVLSFVRTEYQGLSRYSMMSGNP